MKIKSIYGDEAATHFLSRLEKLSAETRPKWGKMNADEMLCHVSDALRETLGDRKSTNKANLMMRTIGKFMVLNVAFPRNAPTHPEFNPKVKGTPPFQFEEDKEKLKSLIGRVTKLKPDDKLPAHPLLGPFTYAQWGKLSAKHLDHHFRQFGI